jgi:fibronectin type 3 domain-containing protein
MKCTIVLFLCLPAGAQTWFTNVTKRPTTNSCTIAWTTAVPTIAHIEYGLAAGSYTKSSANSTTYLRSKTATISGLTAGTRYHFRIVAADTSKDWVKSLDYTCTTATTAAQHSVKLNWQASISPGVTSYQVYRSTISGGYYALLASAATLTYTDIVVQSGTTYYYVLRAINSAGQQSAFSNQVKAVIP